MYVPNVGQDLKSTTPEREYTAKNRCSAHVRPLTTCRYSVSICFIPATAGGHKAKHETMEIIRRWYDDNGNRAIEARHRSMNYYVDTRWQN